jgi:hypothetical protein
VAIASPLLRVAVLGTVAPSVVIASALALGVAEVREVAGMVAARLRRTAH